MNVDWNTLPDEEKTKFKLAIAKVMAVTGRGCGLGCGGCLLYIAIAFAIVVWACSGFPGLR